ncbi:hypothetical protein, partial [Leptospira ryugenii]
CLFLTLMHTKIINQERLLKSVTLLLPLNRYLSPEVIPKYFMKKIIISFLIISCFSLYGNDESKENEIKNNEKDLNKIYLRRNSTNYSATE